MGTPRLMLIMASTVFILLFTSQSVFGGFNDDFSGTLINTDNWIVNENGGSVTLDSGSLVINPLVSTSYPYIHSKSEVFDSENFVFEIRLRLSGPLNYGFGINVTDRLQSNQTTSETTWNDLIYMFWPDASGHYRLNTVMCPILEISCITDHYNSAISVDNLGTWVTYKIEQSSDSAKVYRDGVHINTLRKGIRTPRYIWIGNPQRTSIVSRGKIEIDYISIDTFNQESTFLPPILLIPGFGASWNYQSIFTNTGSGEWVIPSWINTYDNLVNSLQNAGYQRGTNLFVYGYDWRNGLDLQADSLDTYIQSLVSSGKIASDTKINFVAHSFGGLVTRAYLGKYGTGHLGKLITAGSPHQGAAASYKAWSGGQVLLGNWWQKSALSLLVGLNTLKGESPVSAMRRLSPSIKNILPTYEYLIDENNASKSLGSMSVINDYLMGLNSQSSIIDASTSAITGGQVPTIEKMTYEQRSWLDQLLGKWVDGRPVTDITTFEGDGTVTRVSAQGPFTDFQTTDLDHGDLVFDSAGIAEIFQKLGLDVSKIVATASAMDGNNPIVAILRSPGDLKLTTPSDIVVGMGEPSTPSAIVVPEQKLIIIPNPEVGDYQVSVSPDGNTGDYSLFAGYGNSDGLVLKRIDAVLGVGDTDTFLINKISNLSVLETTNDPDFAEILLEISNRINPDSEPLLQNQNRLKNLKTYLTNKYFDYESKTNLAQRNLNLDVLNQVIGLKNNTEMTDQNTVLIDDLISMILSQSSKVIQDEVVDTSLYDTLYDKVVSGEAKLKSESVSTGSAIFLNQIFAHQSPLASQSGNISKDLSDLFLKYIFAN